MGTFLHVLSEQYRTQTIFFGAKRSVLTEHLDLMFPRTLCRFLNGGNDKKPSNFHFKFEFREIILWSNRMLESLKSS